MEGVHQFRGGVLRFGVFEVDLRAGELRKQGVRIKLQDQPFQILQVLLERPGEVVTREELQRRIWPPDTFVDFDHGLHNAIKRLREALGDSAETPRFIETQPKRGYRFIGPVDGKGSTEVVSAQEPQPASTTMTGGGRGVAFTASLLAAGAALAMLLAVDPGSLSGKLNRWVGVGSTSPPIHSLAVLPLRNLSGDLSQDYFADGMTEELITELSRLSSLRVISRTSVMRYKGSNKPLPEIARELGVEGIIEGSVLRSGNRVRITAQLIYAPQDKNIWAQSYERDLEDMLALQSTVASTIADEIRVEMTPGEHAQLRSSRPVNLKAHESYLQGRYHLRLAADALFKKDKGKFQSIEAEKAEKYFRQAIQEDPNYAPPYFGVWEASSAAPLPARDWAPRARPMLLKALQLDDSLAEAHRCLGGIRRGYDWDWRGAESEYQRALQLAPSDADAHTEYARLLANMGRAPEAVKEFEVAQGLDPKNEHMQEAFYWTRQFDRAAELLQNGAQSRPSDFYPHYDLANIYALTGKRREAISEWQKMVAILEHKEMSEAIGRAYKTGGYEKSLRVFTRRLEASSHKTYIPAWFIASIYGYMGDKDRAFAWLEKAYEARDGADGLNDPEWDPLRTDPRFKDLLRRVGLLQ